MQNSVYGIIPFYMYICIEKSLKFIRPKNIHCINSDEQDWQGPLSTV